MSFIRIDIFSNLFRVNLCYLKGYKLLLFTNKKLTVYYKQLSFNTIVRKNDVLVLDLISNIKYLNNFSNFYRNLVFKSRGFLVLKGLGLKVQIIDNCLEFKLGYSHKCFIKIDPEIYIRIKKNLLFFQSINKELLGNFLYKIKMLKQPDVYKGKGIWYKNEKISLKPVKKSK